MQTTKTDWQTITEAGRIAAGQIDEGRFIIGDLACLVVKRYQEDRIGQFATEINVEASRVKDYRRVCAFYEKSARTNFLQENDMISYSHLRRAMAMKTPERAYKLLNKASMRGWTVRQLDRFLVRYRRLFEGYTPPPKPLECEAVVAEIGQDDLTRDYLTLRAPLLSRLVQPGQQLQLKVIIVNVAEVA